ncbi:unnamed protein product [Dibothriocephalus latus]|uniref:Alpha-2-macroglobulin domain-containing protein n=1 Tax=Dibothriocephalus latus TaxID=60516 RepID=A0A3P6QTP8_DIBLA|nr:unnamed protein product [Dibothriocephalus latus]
MANAPLAGKTLYLEFLSRGLQTWRTAVLRPARSGYACSDEDSDLGHYTCNTRFQPGEVGEIICRPGWTENNCLSRYPNRRRDAVRRTIFMHEALFDMDCTFGPTLNAVAYVISLDSRLKGGYELISDHLKIENLKLCSIPAMYKPRLTSPNMNNFNKHTLVPGDRVGLTISVPTARDSNISDVENSCILRLVDTAFKNFENSKDTLIDLNKVTNELHENSQLFYNGSDWDRLNSNLFKTTVRNTIVKPRVRDFFPEVWLFDHITLDQAGYYSTLLTAPDGITSWEFRALCFSQNMGIWMPPRLEPEVVTVSLPFYFELTPPVKAKRHEVLHLPVSVFMLSQTSASVTADEKAF